jgi:hypothetical protein
MSKIRRKADPAARAAKKATAQAKTAVPKAGRRALRSSESLANAPVRKAGARRTRIQKAADQASKPTGVDGQLQASDADVLRIADAIAEQRAELMDRLAQ